MVSMAPNWEDIEKAFASRGRLRILKALYKHPRSGLTRYRLARETRLNREKMINHFKVLTEIGWVSEGSTTPKTYRLNLENLIMKSLIPFLEAIKEMG